MNRKAQQRQKGKSHHNVVRILAFKWIRVIFRCWKTHKPYNETFYLDVLKKRHKRVDGSSHDTLPVGLANDRCFHLRELISRVLLL